MADQGPGQALAGRTVVVSGASSGIGLAAARAIAAAGARVHGLSRRGGGGPFSSHICDVTQPADVTATIDQIASPDGLDAVVIAAGTNVAERHLGQLSVPDWQALIDTNLSGAFHVFRAALPHLRTAHGAALFVGSVSGLWPDASGPAYQASKAGLVGLARAAALEEHRHGVRVSVIAPGLVDTPLLDRRPQPPDAALRAAALQPDDVARGCGCLLSLPARAYIPELTILPTALQALGDTS